MLLFAIAALTSRLWTYNLNTSNLMLVFLLLALWCLAVESTTSDMRATVLYLALAWVFRCHEIEEVYGIATRRRVGSDGFAEP